MTAKEEDIYSFLPVNKYFTKELINDYFIKKGEILSEKNLNVKITRLKSNEIITTIATGLYQLNHKRTFEPELNNELIKINAKLKKHFPYLKYLSWSTIWLNDFTTLQLYKNINIIEVEAGSEEAVFNIIKESFPNKTFLNPTTNDWSTYIADKEECIIVRTLHTESPKKAYNKLPIAKIEKILVDLYSDKLWKEAFANEIGNIFIEVLSNYNLNYSTLLRYASRRSKREEIIDFIKSFHILDEETIKLIDK